MSSELVPLNRELAVIRQLIDLLPDDESHHLGMVKLAELEEQAARLVHNAKIAIQCSVEQRNQALQELEDFKALVKARFYGDSE